MDSQTPLFSIVIPSYNYAHYLPDTINSVLQQPGDDYELIVINDGSKDNTDEVAHSLLSETNNRFRYYYQENKGLPGTRNRGIELAKGRYLFFLDSDDRLTPDALSFLRKAVQQYRNASMIIGRYNSVRPDGRSKPRCLWSLKEDREENFKQYLLDTSVSLLCSAVLFRRDIFNSYQFPTHIRQCEDEPVFAFAFANTEVAKIDDIVSNIQKHDDSLRNQVFLNLSDKLIKEIFNKEMLPAHLMKYETPYRGIRYLDQFRTLYLAGEYEKAWHQFLEALPYNKTAALKPNFLRKAIKSWLKK
ncbi:glycosyltransferase family 2 protein [Endozoicomonas sp.]|nr:glycosyltransferase family 2 protein [Endozoicomonas sp.]